MFIAHNGTEGRGEREGLSDPIRSVIWCGSTIIQRNIAPTSITLLYTRICAKDRKREREKREVYQEESNGFAVVYSLCSALSPTAHTLISVINAHFVSACFCYPPCVGEEREPEHERDFQTHLLLWQSGLWQKKDGDDFWQTLTEKKFPETL